MRKICLFFLLVFTLPAAAQSYSTVDADYVVQDMPDRQSWKVRVVLTTNGDTALIADSKSCVLRCYHDRARGYIPEDFYDRCPDRTEYWLLANATLVAEFRNGMMHGFYKRSDTEVVEEGQMEKGHRTGWWTVTSRSSGSKDIRYHNGKSSYGNGTSLYVNFIGGGLLLIGAIIAAIFLCRSGRFYVFYIALCAVMMISLFLIIGGFRGMENTGDYTRAEDFQELFTVVFITLLVLMPFLSIFNFAIRKNRVGMSILSGFVIAFCALAGVVIYIGSHMGKIGG
jgi:hypothetical protein